MILKTPVLLTLQAMHASAHDICRSATSAAIRRIADDTLCRCIVYMQCRIALPQNALASDIMNEDQNRTSICSIQKFDPPRGALSMTTEPNMNFSLSSSPSITTSRDSTATSARMSMCNPPFWPFAPATSSTIAARWWCLVASIVVMRVSAPSALAVTLSTVSSSTSSA